MPAREPHVLWVCQPELGTVPAPPDQLQALSPPCLIMVNVGFWFAFCLFRARENPGYLDI